MKKNDSFKLLWEKLPYDITANLEFAALVSQREPVNSHYFFTDYSFPILSWITKTVFFEYSDEGIKETISLILSQYYEFVSSPYNKFGEPLFYQLNTYKGLNNMKLESWLKINGCQFFTRQKQKEEKLKKHNTQLIEFIDYETLLSMDSKAEGVSDEELLNRSCIKEAWNLLSDKDKDILHILIIQKLYWEDAYEELNTYINPKGGREVMSNWSNKRKQDALALMKARSIEHLCIRFNEIKNRKR